MELIKLEKRRNEMKKTFLLLTIGFVGFLGVDASADVYTLQSNGWEYCNSGLDLETRVVDEQATYKRIHNSYAEGSASAWAGFAFDIPDGEVVTSVTFTYYHDWGYWIPALFAETGAITSTTYDGNYTSVTGINQDSLNQILACTVWTDGGVGSTVAWGNTATITNTVTFDVSEGISSIALGLVTKAVLAPGTPGLVQHAADASGQEWIQYSDVTIETTAVPEPATLTLLALGTTTVMFRRKK